jgi:hypothetical protein
MRLNTPQELLKELSKKKQDLADSLIQDLAKVLSIKFTGSDTEVWLVASFQEFKLVEDILKAELLKKGWDFSLSKQAEGRFNENHICLVVTAITSSTKSLNIKNEYSDDLYDVVSR